MNEILIIQYYKFQSLVSPQSFRVAVFVHSLTLAEDFWGDSLLLDCTQPAQQLTDSAQQVNSVELQTLELKLIECWTENH